jgi:hypothetical protein
MTCSYFPSKNIEQQEYRGADHAAVHVVFLTDASRPDGVGTVTQEEKEKFTEIKERLRVQLEYQLTNFRQDTLLPTK